MMKVSTTITNELLVRLNDEIATQLVSQVPLVGEVGWLGGTRLAAAEKDSGRSCCY
ncbi:MAG: hypothetical protein ACJ0GF_03440 [Burkholderiales bacterium]